VRKDSVAYTFGFALAVCVICSFALSVVSEGLKKRKELNVKLDIKKNILKAVDLKDPLPEKVTADQVFKVYNEKIQEIVVDGKGNILEEITPYDLGSEETDRFAMYIYKEGGVSQAYCFPVIGKGLWSTLYGYFALESDAVTVRGITFYQHGETPGLGAEIDQDWFQSNFVGKKIWDIKEEMLRPTKVIKGKVADKYKGDEADYHVDGISGATITSRGVTAMLDKWLNIYEPFLQQIRKSKQSF